MSTRDTKDADANKGGPSSVLRIIRYLLWGVVIVVMLGLGANELWGPDRSGPAPATTQAVPDFIKSDFALVDHTGKPVTDEDYRGKWLLVFFGFTNCPDICPTVLNEISQVMANIGEKALEIQPLFITVDPERDTPERMAEYVAAFDPRITGLTGTPEQIEASTKSFKVYYVKEIQKDAPDGYTMGHTASLYLIDPNGRFVKRYAYKATVEEITADIQQRL